MIKNDASGKAHGLQGLERSIDLILKPNWDPKTDFRPAYVNTMTIKESNDDADSSPRAASSSGSGLVQRRRRSRPAPVIKQALAAQPGPDRRSSRAAATAASR